MKKIKIDNEEAVKKILEKVQRRCSVRMIDYSTIMEYVHSAEQIAEEKGLPESKLGGMSSKIGGGYSFAKAYTNKYMPLQL